MQSTKPYSVGKTKGMHYACWSSDVHLEFALSLNYETVSALVSKLSKKSFRACGSKLATVQVHMRIFRVITPTI